MSKEIFLVAGEASGDLHASGVADAIRQLRPDVPLTGIGGPRMAAAGVRLEEDVTSKAVVGFVEVLRHVPRHWAMLRSIRARMQQGRVGLIVVLDYPGFNMKVAAAAREAGVPVLYYITPQVWAWGAGRLSELARIITRAAVILPFEEELLRSNGIDATFVGHPLLDRAGSLPSQEQARVQLDLQGDQPVLALFPGSRTQEVTRHLEPFVASAEELVRRVPSLRVRVGVAPTVKIEQRQSPFPLVHGRSFALLRAADAALCKSGTTTLEAAVADCPLAVAYRTSGWTYAIARRVVKIPHIGLVNVVAGREVAPEFVQDALQPGAVADVLEPLLTSAEARAEARESLAEVRSRLGTAGASMRVAHIALDMLR